MKTGRIVAIVGAVLVAIGIILTPVATGGPDTMVVRWEGESDIDMLRQVERNLNMATTEGYRVLRVDLTSPGGPIITSMEIARQIRRAVDNGLIVEIHARVIVASGGTFILAAGSPGRRFVAEGTLVVMHGLQSNGFMTPLHCVEPPDNPQTEREKVLKTLTDEMVKAFSRYTRRSPDEVRGWLKCGQERAGSAALAVELGLADRQEA